jgi:hypothetical protein
MLNSEKIFRALRDKKNKYSNSRDVRKNISIDTCEVYLQRSNLHLIYIEESV